MKKKTRFTSKQSIIVLLLLFAILLPVQIFSQTMDNPIVISLNPLSQNVKAGEQSALLLSFKVPRGYWLGNEDPSSRNPSATLIEIVPADNFNFELPRFPKSIVAGVPVHKGTTNIYEGDLNVIIPFTTNSNVEDGEYKLTLKLTYTPGLNAGQLITHIDEEYSTTVKVSETSSANQIQLPEPFIGEVPQNFLVKEEIVTLPEPMNSILYRWKEDTPVPDFLHWMWVDPENHGKHIQTVMAPFIGNTENNGFTIGGSVALLNLTPEGIMTGLFQLRALYNEFFGANFAVEAVSCPAAYFNYWLSAEISTNGENKQLNFHIENLTLGDNDRFGYEIQTDIFKDPRFRFYGIGPQTKEEDKTIYTHSQVGTVLDLYWMPADHFRLGVGGKVKSVAVNDAAEKLRGKDKFTTTEISAGGKFAEVPGIKGATVYGERFNIVYDGRNSEFLPTDGFYGKLTAEYNQITDQVITAPQSIKNYGKFIADLRQYFSTVGQKFTLLFRNDWTITTSKYAPFFDQATIGGDFSDRAFDGGRFYGQNSVFASMEIRYQAFHIDLMGTPWTVEMAPFLDTATLFDSDGFNGRVNVNPGMSFRMLNKPNVGMVGNIAWGQDGIILTGGVQLPF